MFPEPGDVRGFEGRYRFLSNFWRAEVWLDTASYPTVEHAYQAAKTIDANERQRVKNAPTPGKAKFAGRRVTLRSDWEVVKVGVMASLVMQKFREHPELGVALMETDGMLLVEDNTWGDRFWGVCEGAGENWLGRILMGVREALLTEVV
jgi:ribA/ribD-fused uncharacterized protein